MQTKDQIRPDFSMLEDARFITSKRPWFGKLPETLTGDYAFAVVGDRCGMATAGVFEKALEVLKDLQPAFVLAVGDLIEGYWTSPASAHEEWDELDAMVQATGLPFFPAVGNHDYGNAMMADVWSERKGMDYYAFRAGDALYITINTEHTPDELPEAFMKVVKTVTEQIKRDPAGAKQYLRAFGEALTPEQLQGMSQVKMTIGEEQFAFIESVLNEHQDVSWTFINMHKPGWKTGSEQFARLEQLLSNRPHTMFAGHLHELEYTREGNRELIQLGRTGGLPHGEEEVGANANMILWVTMRAGVPTYRVVHLDGVQDITAYPPHTTKHAKE
ncbi:metallophosphoesterase [Paenibacillus doosanensis]|uniref:metallophosphoesterase family protein n=1 Tax=Paenibacillus doosanensis TaxID=1229154 RepID=UPI00217FD03C|nr:metallophosphoesterase [Paenibacillus doosanensis]MCS7464042.1 metallophosphoesterase [Paenibacillus doosanensis]